MERSTHTLAVKSQNWFVEALFQLIQQKTFEEITISELCKQANLDRRTFYRNFKDKNDVLLFYFFTLEDEYLAVLKRIQERTFYTLAKVYFEFWACHLEFLKTAQSDPSLFAMLIQMLNSFMPSVYAQASGRISKELQYNISFVTGGFHNVLIHWISSGFQESPEKMAAAISEMFDDTISYWPDI